MEPPAPGTAPRTTSRLLPASTRTTLTLRSVTLSVPMCPAPFMPGSTREGKAEAPIEPGARWNIEPWVAAPPRKWWRLTTPWKPLPRLVPATVIVSPAANSSTETLSPTLTSAPSSTRNSRRTRQGGSPAFSKWPFMAFVTFFALRASTRPSCTAE